MYLHTCSFEFIFREFGYQEKKMLSVKSQFAVFVSV